MPGLSLLFSFVGMAFAHAFINNHWGPWGHRWDERTFPGLISSARLLMHFIWLFVVLRVGLVFAAGWGLMERAQWGRFWPSSPLSSVCSSFPSALLWGSGLWSPCWATATTSLYEQLPPAVISGGLMDCHDPFGAAGLENRCADRIRSRCRSSAPFTINCMSFPEIRMRRLRRSESLRALVRETISRSRRPDLPAFHLPWRGCAQGSRLHARGVQFISRRGRAGSGRGRQPGDWRICSSSGLPESKDEKAPAHTTMKASCSRACAR